MADGGFGSRRNGTTTVAPTSSGGFGSLRNKAPSKSKAKSKGHHGVTGFFQNAAGDVRDMAVGTVPGIINTASAVGKDIADLPYGLNPQYSAGHFRTQHAPFERTTNIAKGIRDQYVQNYGSRKGFTHALYNDPLFIALDALTVLSGGTSAAAKAGIITGKAGKTIELASGAGKTTKTLASRELRAQAQSAAARLGNAEIKIGSNVIRQPGHVSSKLDRTRLTRVYTNERSSNEQFNRSLRRYGGKHAKVATALLGRYDRPTLDMYVNTLRETALKEGPNSPAAKTVRIIETPQVQKLFDNPTPAIQAVLDEARPLGKKTAELTGIDAVTAEQRRFLPARIATGARWNPSTGHWEGGKTIGELRAQGLDPIYLPDTSSKAKEVGKGSGAGGIGIPAPTGNMKQNKGVLALAGQLVLDPATLNESFLRAAKRSHYQAIHDRLLEIATPVDKPGPGQVLIRRKASERVNPLDKSSADFNEWADANLDKNGQMAPRKEGDTSGFVASGTEDAAKSADGKYLAVPEGVAKTLAGEFTRQSKLVYNINKYPMRVWRALVLGLRPAYLVNNVVGNTLMYLVHSGRPEDLRQLAGAFKQFAHKSQHSEIDALLNKHFAGQVKGGFTATQFPEYSGSRKLVKAAGAVTGAIPHLDRRWEQALRRGKVIAEMKRHPALKEHAQRMGRETSEFKNLDRILRENPDVVDQVYNKVNDALGNYDSMSKFEQGTMRNLFPFYAWFKSITGVAAKLAIDQPLKVAVLGRLGQIAIDQNLASAGLNREDIPTSLLGFIPTKREGDRVRGFNTGPANPFGTVGQLADFAASFTEGSGAPGRKLPGTNPLYTDIASYVFGQTPGGYPANEIPGLGTFDALPQSRLLGSFERNTGIDIPFIKPAPDGNTLNDRDVIDELLRYFGIPYARVSPTAAKKVAHG